MALVKWIDWNAFSEMGWMVERAGVRASGRAGGSAGERMDGRAGGRAGGRDAHEILSN